MRRPRHGKRKDKHQPPPPPSAAPAPSGAAAPSSSPAAASPPSKPGRTDQSGKSGKSRTRDAGASGKNAAKAPRQAGGPLPHHEFHHHNEGPSPDDRRFPPATDLDPAKGLTAAQVATRVELGLVNRTKRSDFADYVDIVRRNVLTLFNLMVTPAAVALFTLGEWKGGLAVSVLAFVNTVISLMQEVHAKRSLDKLTILVETKARVLRGGREESVPAGEVVQDDVVLVGNGEAVVADGPVLESRFLEVDEALLTGESDPIRKAAGDGMLSGSYCVAGEGRYRAARVGVSAFAQRTSAAARSYSAEQSPLQAVINMWVGWLSYTAVGLCAAYLLVHWSTGLHVDPALVKEANATPADVRPGSDPAGAGSPETPKPEEKKEEKKKDPGTLELVKLIAVTITSMVPQGLVLTATVAFTLGAIVMSRRGAIVQKITAVESMAAVDVVCTDKTGTLTTNRLKLESVFPLAGADEAMVRAELRVLASATVDEKNKSVQALRTALGTCSTDLLDTLPFKSQNRYSAVRVRIHEGATAEGGRTLPAGERVFAMGAVEALSPLLTDPSAIDAARMAELMKTGLRLLLFTAADETRPFDGSLAGWKLRPRALLALSDELRPEAADVLKKLTAQGIAFKIISGDNPETVKATVGALDIPASREPVVSGPQLAKSDDVVQLVRDHSVFGRVAPNQKVDIVEALQSDGRYVAMIGDGVNDILPIKKSHLGIAMGDGSPASKTVAGLVLENNNFALLPETLEEGRTIVRNLRRSAKLFLTKNVYSLLFLLLGAFGVFGMVRPYDPQQVTLLNWLTIGVPAFVIALSRERSTGATRPDFAGEVGWFALRTGACIAAGGIVLELIAAWGLQADGGMMRTMLLSLLTLMGLTTLLRALTDGEVTGLQGDAMYRWFALAAVPLFLAFLYLPITATFFNLSPMGWLEWVAVAGVFVPTYLVTVWTDTLPAPWATRK